MTIWILEDTETKIPEYEIIKGDIHKVYKNIGWRYNLYKCNNKDVIIPNDKNKLFKFKGYKCKIIDNISFNSSICGVNCTVDLTDKDFKKFPYLKKLFDYIKSYEYFDKIVEYEEYESFGWLKRKKEKHYKFFINEFIPKPNDKLETNIISSYKINSKFNIDND